jgi:hypothetical protein
MSATLSAYKFGYILGAQTAREKQALLDVIGHAMQPALRAATAVRPAVMKPTFLQKATQFVTGRAATPAVPLRQKLKELAMNRVVKPGMVGLSLLGGGHTAHNAMIQAPKLNHITQTINGVAQPSRTLVNGVQVLQGGAPVALNAAQNARLATVGHQKPMWDLIPGVTGSAKNTFNPMQAAQQFAQHAR